MWSSRFQLNARRERISGNPNAVEDRSQFVELHAKSSELLQAVEGVLGAEGSTLRLAERGSTTSKFSTSMYFDELKPHSFGQVLILAKMVTTTQHLLSVLNASLPEGTVFVADQQSHGRGRGDNQWDSRDGCLMFSFTSIFHDGKTLPCVPYLASVAMLEAAKSYLTELHTDYQPNSLSKLRIKWPNDLYFENAKIGGILCNSVFVEGAYYTTVGVGFNVNNKEPSSCLADAVDRAAGSIEIAREILLAKFFEYYSQMKSEFCLTGFSCIKEKYVQNWMHSGQLVNLQEEHDENTLEISLIIKGLTDAGLLLANERGQQYELSPDGNSLDFFSGLIRRKLLT